MLTFPCPTAVHGGLLRDQLAAAGLTTQVSVNGDTLELPDLNEADRSAAQSVVDAHAATAQAAAAEDATKATNETTIRDRATTALADNKAFLALTSPTNAQNAAQVKALTRQVNGLIRLTLRRFDSTD